jgi:hypothetical protein
MCPEACRGTSREVIRRLTPQPPTGGIFARELYWPTYGSNAMKRARLMARDSLCW